LTGAGEARSGPLRIDDGPVSAYGARGKDFWAAGSPAIRRQRCPSSRETRA
jgi:hypothetical protein